MNKANVRSFILYKAKKDPIFFLERILGLSISPEAKVFMKEITPALEEAMKRKTILCYKR